MSHKSKYCVCAVFVMLLFLMSGCTNTDNIDFAFSGSELKLSSGTDLSVQRAEFLNERLTITPSAEQKNDTAASPLPTKKPTATPTPIPTEVPKEPFAYSFTPLTVDTDSAEDSNITAKAALLIDLTDERVIFSKNVHTQIYPASTTKLLTALIAMKYCDSDELVTVKEDDGGIAVKGAQLCGLKKGDTITVKDLLKGLLICSGNDAGAVLAEHISGSISEFCNKMKLETELLCAYDTSFTNPHGLHQNSHYSTAYDLYLIMNECIKYDEFLEIAGMRSAAITYYNENKDAVTQKLESTNLYLTKGAALPDGFSVIGGKTGSTTPAGNCLILLTRNSEGHIILSELFKVDDRVKLYEEMNYLLSLSTISE